MSTKQRFVNMKTSLMDAWERFDKLHKSKRRNKGRAQRFSGIGQLVGWISKSDLIILAARPSIGKSALALDIARNVACKGGVPVGNLQPGNVHPIFGGQNDRFRSPCGFLEIAHRPAFQRRRVCQNKRRSGQAFHGADIHRR